MMKKEMEGKDKIVIQASNLHKSFDMQSIVVPVIKGVNLKIKEGSLVAIFGPSGCGKTTLINLLMGIENPTKGKVGLFGKDLFSMDADMRAEFREDKVGVVNQQPNWIKSLNVLENVSFPLILAGYKKKKAEEKALETLSQLRMDLWAYYLPTQLSSGQQQKVTMARALVNDPKIIFADEPTGNLDSKSGEELLSILEELNKEGKTIIIISHDSKHLKRVKTVYQMFDGYIVNRFNVKDLSEEGVESEIEKFSGEKSGDGRTGYKIIPKIEEKKGLDLKRRFKVVLGELKNLLVHFKTSLVFVPFLFLYFIEKTLDLFKKILNLLNIPTTEGSGKLFAKFYSLFEKSNRNQSESIVKRAVVDLAFKNLFSKKSRTIVTIGGVAIGYAIIVFLLSVGFGLEGLVLDRIGSLDQKKQIEAIPAIGSNIVLNEEVIENIVSIDGVDTVSPQINVPSKIYYKDSITDVVTYGVDSTYLQISDIKFLEGDSGSIDESGESIVVNEALVEVWGEDRKSLIGSSLTASFIEEGGEDNSIKQDFLIKGIVEEGENPIIYSSLGKIKKLGFSEYSQIKVIINDINDLGQLRNNIEGFGFSTISIVDTITRIEQLFSTLRFAMSMVGLTALSISALGMFNTLTVSLLERTREVGLMKILGMKSDEVYDLFQTESIIMGIFGGTLGIVLGIVFGKLVSLLLSILAISRGFSSVDVTETPMYLTLVIIFVSLTIGVITGYYPAFRATKISPLDALRYE